MKLCVVGGTSISVVGGGGLVSVSCVCVCGGGGVTDTFHRVTKLANCWIEYTKTRLICRCEVCHIPPGDLTLAVTVD